MSPADPSESAGPASVPGRAKVLVLDDEPLVARTLMRILQGAHDVRVLHGVAEALALFAAGERFDAILCDLMMPGLTGMDFYRRLGELAEEQRERIVFITGGAFTQSADDFLLQIPNLLLNKPFEAQEVRDAVGAILSRKEALPQSSTPK